jgi:hypothetical protein
MERELVIQSLAAAPALLRRLTDDLSPEQATRAPKPGEWTVTEVARHLVDGDRDTFLPRLRRILAEERPVFESRDRRPSADRSDLATLLGAFESARGEVVKILQGLEPEEWSREGVSPSRGPLSVEAYARSMAEHDGEHLAQVQQIREALGLRPKRAAARVALPLPELLALTEPTPERVRALARDLTPAELRRRPREGDWSMKEVVAHLLKVERDLFLPRLRRIAEEDRPAIERFDPDAWARERDHREGDFMADLAEFAAARRRTREFLAGLPPGAPERVGVFLALGPLTLGAYAAMLADHDAEHLAQLQACRAALTGH